MLSCSMGAYYFARRESRSLTFSLNFLTGWLIRGNGIKGILFPLFSDFGIDHYVLKNCLGKCLAKFRGKHLIMTSFILGLAFNVHDLS